MKQENLTQSEDLKQDIFEYTIDKLGNCQVFTRNIGDKKFILNKLKANIEKAYYTEEKSPGYTGLYAIEDKCIVICKKNEKDENATYIHEAIHAILARKDNNGFSTGLLNIIKAMEIGRGLNEGLTEWIVKKCGVKSNAYASERSIVDQLELCIGEDKVMKLAKGDIKGKIPKMMKMSEYDLRVLLRQVDILYDLGELSRKREKIISTLYKNIVGDNDLNNELLNNKIYTNEISGPEFAQFLKENNLTNNSSSQLEYFRKSVKENYNDAIKQKDEINNKILEKYFQNELLSLRNRKRVTINQSKLYIEKYDKYFGLVCSNISGDFDDKCAYSELKSLKEQLKEADCLQVTTLESKIYALSEYIKTRRKLCKPILKETLDKIKKGDISTNELYGNVRLMQSEELITEISKQILPEGSPNINKMNELLRKKNFVENLENANFITLDTNGNKRDLCITSNNKEISIDEINKNKRKLIDFTIKMDYSFEKIINNASEFLEKLKEQYPNAKITILNDAVMVNRNEKQEFYTFEDETIKKAEITHKENVNIKYKEEKSLAIPDKKMNLFKKFKSLFKKKSNQTSNPDVENEIIDTIEKRKKFVDDLMPNKYPYGPEDIKDTIQISSKKKEEKQRDI